MLSIQDQFNAAVGGWAQGDFALTTKLLTDPGAVTPDETRTWAEKHGFSGTWLEGIANLATDPFLWISLALSKHFPTGQYLKGVIPRRFVGTNNEFSGLSRVFRTVDSFFRGTGVPEMTALKVRREMEVLQIGNKIFDETITRPNWANEKEIVSLLLEGQKPQGATPELVQLSGRIRTHMDDLWKFLSQAQDVTGGITGGGNDYQITAGSSAPIPPNRAPRYLRDYLPHIPLLGDESTIISTAGGALEKLSRSRSSQAGQLAQFQVNDVWKIREGALQSDWHQYQKFMSTVGTQVFNPRIFQRQRHGVPLQSVEGAGLFVTDLDTILQKYVHGVARTYALNAPVSPRERTLASWLEEDAFGNIVRRYPDEQPLSVQILNKSLQASGVDFNRKIQRQVLGTDKFEERLDLRNANFHSLAAANTLMKNIMGKADESDIIFGSAINKIRSDISNVFKNGSKEQLELEKGLSSMERRRKDQNVTNFITNWFYGSTLGLNVGSAIRNLFQPFLTTAPAIGLGPTLEGMAEMGHRYKLYLKKGQEELKVLWKNKSLHGSERILTAQDRAFKAIFPELASAGITSDPRAYELAEAAILSFKGNEHSFEEKLFNRSDKFVRLMMYPFQQAELANQATTFFGAKRALLKGVQKGVVEAPLHPDGNPLDSGEFLQWVNNQAADAVGALQFRPGPGSRTPVMASIPGPFRQLLGFPVRLMNHFADSTVRGALTEKEIREGGVLGAVLGGRNWGTIVRGYALGRVVTEGLRSTLGVDYEDAVGVTGPFTDMVESGRLFNPLNIAPLPNVIHQVASFTSTRDIRELEPLELPGIGPIPIPKLLVPGGVAFSRLGRVQRAFRPDMGGFVDDEERLIYQSDTMDAYLGMVGIPLDKERRYRDAMDRVAANRLRIRDYRRQYAVAARNYDGTTMSNLEANFKKDFPDLPGLTASTLDVQRYQDQAQLTSLDRLLTSMGEPGRIFREEMYQYDPQLFSMMENEN